MVKLLTWQSFLIVRFLVFPTIYHKHDCIAYKRLVDKKLHIKYNKNIFMNQMEIM